MDDGERSWMHTVVVGLAALAASALLIGSVLALVAVGAARVTGLGETTGSSGPPASLYLPPYQKTPQAHEPQIDRPTPRARISAVPLDPNGGPTVGGDLTLVASPTSVPAGQRINLSGTYPQGDGASLQVQRREGAAWMDFPTTATVRGGAYSTYVFTGRSGPNEFRVFDSATGRSSNPVVVTVG